MNEPKKILVADDESQIIRVMRRILTTHQYHIRTASDGESALDLFDD
jgi:CheY-like chemotaxis protein